MKHFSISIAWLFSFFWTSQLLYGQDNCIFQTHIRKGSNYVFSTYLAGDYKTPLEGKCESFIQGQLYERREFLHGHLISEEANFQDGKPRIILKTFTDRSDGMLAELRSYWENGQPAMYCVYYLDESGRRCMKQTDYHLNGKKRFVQFFAFVRLSEISQYEIKNHPPHTVDDEGYTSLQVQFGDEENYSNEGVLISRFHHKLILSEFSRDSSKDGPFTEYHENGKVKTKGRYKDGNPDGAWVGYNYLGMKNVELTYKDNIIQGFYRTWFDNGQLQTEHFYDVSSNHPFQPSKKEWNEQGKLLLDLVLDKEGNGYMKKWNNDGILLYETSISANNYKKDIEIERYPDGKIKSILNHLPNADTTYVAYFPNGQMSIIHFEERSKENAKLGRKVQKEWFENGILAQEVEIEQTAYLTSFLQNIYYSNGNSKSLVIQKDSQQNEEVKGENGLKTLIPHKKTDRYEELYASNGIKIRSRHTVDGKLEGPYRELDSLGNVLVAYSYSNGLRNGTCRRYNAKQELIFSQEYENGCLISSKTDVNNKRKISILGVSERTYVYGLAHQQIIRTLKEHYTPEEIDSLVQWYSYIIDCTPFSSFTFPSIDVGEQLLFLRLPEAAFPGLLSGDTTNYRVKEIVTSFAKLGWDLPKWHLENGIYVGKIHLEGLYSPQILNTYFSFCQSWMEFAYTKENPRDRQVDYGMKRYQRQNSINLSRVNACLMKAALTISFGSVSLLIYSDGEVEVENQLYTNEELLKENPNMIHEIGWD
jgi:antitoxin component YwqK of YwqJK toxin-antitoxin module